MGPGVVLKSALAERFSLLTFGISQVAIDLQPAFVILTGRGSLHGISHTYLGATVIGVLVAPVARGLCPWMLGLWRAGFNGPDWLRDFPDPGWGVVIASALLGTWSHVLVDSVMHADMAPWWPREGRGAWLGIVTAADLHLICFSLGVVGGVAWLVRRWRGI